MLTSAVGYGRPVEESAEDAFRKLLTDDWEGVDIPIPPRKGSPARWVDFSE